MRKKTEYSEHPAPCVVLSRGASATVILRDNIARLEDAEDGAERWEADEYRISTTNRENLGARVEENAGAWLEKAKQNDRQGCAAEVRAKRNELIAGLDFMFTSDYPAQEDEKARMGAYRQALRDIPEQEGFPYDVVWPVKPK